ncbi:MAG: hypothetical protein RL757_181 [Bacteroidota bacterium]|jgi:hypothetical protein
MKEILDGQNLLKEKEFSEEGQQDLKRAAAWARFISIVLYLCFGFLALAFFMMFIYIGTNIQLIGTISLYLALGVLIFFMAQYLIRFSSQIVSAFMQQSASMTHGAFRNLRLYMQLCFFASICWLLYSFFDLITFLL